MKLCLIWKLHQPNSWHPRQARYTLPWMRIQTLRAYAPLLRMALEPWAFPVTLAVSPELLEFLEYCSLEGQRDLLLELHCKPAEQLRPADVDELLAFAFEAGSKSLAAPFPRYAAYFRKWQAMRGNIRRLRESLSTEDLQDLQGLSQLAWLDAELQQQAQPALALAREGRALVHHHAVAIAELQWRALRDFLRHLQSACGSGQVEYLGGALHQAILPLLAGMVDDFRYAEDGRAQIVRGPRVHYRHFGLWPPVLHLAEGAWSTECATLMAQSCLDWAIVSSRVLEKSLCRSASASERTASWSHRGRTLRFTDAGLSGRFRFVYPALDPQIAFEDFCGRVKQIAAEAEGDGGASDEAVLVVEIHPALGAGDDPERAMKLWRQLLQSLPREQDVEGTRLDRTFRTASAKPLTEVVSWTERARGFARWLPAAHPVYWGLLRHARRQFQNVRAWKTLSPESLAAARGSLLALESKDWVDCMEAGLDPFTRRRSEELLRAHFEMVYRKLEIDRPPELAEALFPCETRITSIGPSRDITPVLDGKRSSYNSWSGSGYFRARQEGICAGDSWRQISELYFGADGVCVYVRTALPLPAAEMLEQFELQGVLHAADGEQTVTWFQVRQQEGETKLTTRLAVPPATRVEEQPLAIVGEVVDLRIPLSALGIRLGEVLRLQVSLWEQGNAVAAAPPLGWEEFVVGDSFYHTDPDSPFEAADLWERHGSH
ncbi:MAG: hypothetical protein KIT83_05175 [Bryobacterales bacterium]|nr:hypothetical protein [Bryobacterales bacterium]